MKLPPNNITNIYLLDWIIESAALPLLGYLHNNQVSIHERSKSFKKMAKKQSDMFGLK